MTLINPQEVSAALTLKSALVQAQQHTSPASPQSRVLLDSTGGNFAAHLLANHQRLKTTAPLTTNSLIEFTSTSGLKLYGKVNSLSNTTASITPISKAQFLRLSHKPEYQVTKLQADSPSPTSTTYSQKPPQFEDVEAITLNLISGPTLTNSDRDIGFWGQFASTYTSLTLASLIAIILGIILTATLK